MEFEDHVDNKEVMIGVIHGTGTVCVVILSVQGNVAGLKVLISDLEERPGLFDNKCPRQSLSDTSADRMFDSEERMNVTKQLLVFEMWQQGPR